MAGDIFLWEIPASRQPSARAMINFPTSWVVAKPAVTPVDLTRKSRSSSLSTRAALRESKTVF